MRAIVIEQYGGPEQPAIRDLPDPEPLPGHVVIEVKAFGLNHAEIYFRKGVWGDVAKVSGIECVGVIKADQERPLRRGSKGGGPHGRHGECVQRKLRGIHACASGQRGACRNCDALD
jgi:NADPH:quinone reductase-like Zn-dependent oxidoreductase